MKKLLTFNWQSQCHKYIHMFVYALALKYFESNRQCSTRTFPHSSNISLFSFWSFCVSLLMQMGLVFVTLQILLLPWSVQRLSSWWIYSIITIMMIMKTNLLLCPKPVINVKCLWHGSSFRIAKLGENWGLAKNGRNLFILKLFSTFVKYLLPFDLLLLVWFLWSYAGT